MILFIGNNLRVWVFVICIRNMIPNYNYVDSAVYISFSLFSIRIAPISDAHRMCQMSFRTKSKLFKEFIMPSALRLEKWMSREDVKCAYLCLLLHTHMRNHRHVKCRERHRGKNTWQFGLFYAFHANAVQLIKIYLMFLRKNTARPPRVLDICRTSACSI